MKTARTKIDVYAGTLSMEFGDITVHFNINEHNKHQKNMRFIVVCGNERIRNRRK